MSEQGQQDKTALKPLFNRLSLLDCATLVCADMVVGLSEIALENTKKNRWHYLAYASGFVGVFAGAAVPCPPPVMEIVPLAGMAAWVHAFFPQGKPRLRESFCRTALEEKYASAFIADITGADENLDSGVTTVKTKKLLLHALESAHTNMWAAHKYFWSRPQP